MIDASAIATIVATYCGLWAVGFGLGKSYAWIRAIRNAA